MDLASILGWVATTLFTICYVPQIIKTLKSGTVNGLSFWLLFISFVANIIALVYATLIHQQPLQVKYTLALLFLGMTMAAYLKVWRKTNGALKAPEPMLIPVNQKNESNFYRK